METDANMCLSPQGTRRPVVDSRIIAGVVKVSPPLSKNLWVHARPTTLPSGEIRRKGNKVGTKCRGLRNSGKEQKD